MKKQVQFILPLAGLNPGIHEYKYLIESDFFSYFDNSTIEAGKVHAEVVLDKQLSLMTLDIIISGEIDTVCDRCVAAISLPVEGSEQILFKFSEEEKEEDEVLYIHPKTGELDIAPFIFECIHLATPMIRVFDCETKDPRPCNMEVLSRIHGDSNNSLSSDGKDLDNPFFDILKQWDN